VGSRGCEAWGQGATGRFSGCEALGQGATGGCEALGVALWVGSRGVRHWGSGSGRVREGWCGGLLGP
jgi:hypothetical protein